MESTSELLMYFAKLINECPTNDFNYNSDGVIDNDALSDYLDSKISDLKNKTLDIVKTCLMEKVEYETEKTFSLSSVENLFFMFSIMQNLFNYLSIQYSKQDDKENSTLSQIVANGMMIFQSIVSLYQTGCNFSVISQFRSLYENYIVFRYLSKYRQLIKPFRDHFEITKIEMLKESGANLDEKTEELEKDLLKKYWEHFNDDYGWTNDVIKNRNEQKLVTMAKDLGLQDYYNPLYKISCKYVHPSAFSVAFNNSQQADDEFLKPFLYAVVELASDHLIYLMQDLPVPEKDRIIIMNLLYYLREDLYGEEPYKRPESQ